MQSLSHNQLKTLIQLESQGKITPKEIYKRCALAKVQAQDNYVSTALVHAAVGVMLVGLAGQLIIPIIGASWLYTWFKSYRTRQDSIRRINSGNIVDYLDDDDRISFEQDMKALETVAAVVVPTEPAVQVLAAPDFQDRAIADFQVADPIVSMEPATTAVNHVPSDNRNLLELVAENPKSSFFSAPARTGKGVTIAGCIRMVQNRVKAGNLQGVTFWAMTPKQDPKENWYWETCDQFFNPNIETGDRALAARSIYQFINDFGRLPRSPENPTILVVDELTRLIGLLKGIKMADVDPELFAHDSKSFADWLVDKIIYSASMSQSVGYYVWVATPSNAIGNRGFAKGDVGSLNIFTLATKDNLKFADGGSAAFSAPKTDSNHPVFARGFVAGYCHQSQRWYAVPDLSPQLKGRSAVPVRLQNVWTPGSFAAVQAGSVLTEIKPPDEDDGKLNLEKPSLPRSELLLIAAELAEWIAQHPDLNRKDWCSRWNAHKRGFSRPQFRYLLTLIED
jgi:hypothetical protein